MSQPRSWLFVPADSEKKIAKAIASEADAIIFDLEDSVAPDRKQAARAALELDLKRGLDLELDLFALLAPTKDRREAAQAFAERREPRFTGE